MKKSMKVILVLVLLVLGVICVWFFARPAKETPFENLFVKGFEGHTTYEKEVKMGDRIYFGAITEKDALEIAVYNKSSVKIKSINDSDLKLVESFGGEFGIYCYTVNDSNVKYIRVPSDVEYEQYYTSIQISKSDKTTEEEIVDKFITKLGLQKPLSTTVDALKGKSALFLGDSITYGEKDNVNIYECGGWAGRIGYFCDMDVLNKGVSGACVTTARIDSYSKKHYIYNNLVTAKNQQFDYVIMHGVFDDASEKVEVGTPQGKANFDPEKADVSKYADALELLFYTAMTQHPDSTLGYIVNFRTARLIDQEPYVEAAISICKDWGIPYLDLYNDESFTVEFDDGLHPTSAGYDVMYTRVANWMASLNKESESNDTVTSSARVMSYNVFWSPEDEIPNKGITIKNRVQKVTNAISACDPDILVLQEVSTGVSGWVSKLKKYADGNGYGFYGFGHYKDKGIDTTENINTSTIMGSEVEMTPILWKTSKYDCVDKGHFWASSTPNVAGSIWEDVESDHESGKFYPRCVNWLILKNKKTQEQIMVVSYHADPATEKVRNLSAQLVMEKVTQISAKYDNLAVVMAGDWNMQREQVAYSIVTGNGFNDAQKIGAVTTVQATFSAWKRSLGSFGEADYIFVDDDVFVAEFSVYNVMDPEQVGIYITDHSPVIADIEY